MGEATVPIKVSAKSARLPFHGCEPEFIRTVCHARCCDAPTRPTGTLITIHPSEEAAIRAHGGKVVGGMLQPRPGERRCPFKLADSRCNLHGTPDKPFGCIASPFTLNRKGTLIIRNRYKLLKCFRAGKQIPAYRAFRESLVLLCGGDEAARITRHLDGGGGDLQVRIAVAKYRMLMENDEIKHACAP